MRFLELEENLAALERSAESLKDTFESLLRAGPIPIYMHDSLIWQIAIRTRAVTHAFCSLLREDNEYVASILIRINLEHLLLLQAGEIHPGGSEGLVNDLMAGKQLGQIKDKSGKNMTGRYLSKQFDETGPYVYVDERVIRVIPESKEAQTTIEGAWGFYSGLVHFDRKWLFAGLVSVEEEEAVGTVTHVFPRDKYTISRVQAEDVVNWIGIMQFVVENVHAVLMGCVLHAHVYTDETD